jgi:hypothetical protein
MEKINRLIFPLLLAAIVWTNGCATQKPDPLAGFHVSSLGNLDSNKAINDDYHAYINQLSPKETKYMGPTFYYEDGTGQHAVRIETDINGTDCWYHILFYDKENRRTKVAKYFYGHYTS